MIRLTQKPITFFILCVFLLLGIVFIGLFIFPNTTDANHCVLDPGLCAIFNPGEPTPPSSGVSKPWPALDHTRNHPTARDHVAPGVQAVPLTANINHFSLRIIPTGFL